MPAPLDLTGRRFGSLVVLSAGPMVRWGRPMRSWVCRCDCGAIVEVPQNRLPHRASIPESHRVTACDACRAKPCAVCGGLVPASSSAVVCSPECLIEHKRRYHLAWYHHKRATDPGFVATHRVRARTRYQDLTPIERRAVNKARRHRELASHGKDGLNARARQQHAERMADPDYREKQRLKSLRWRREHLKEVRHYQNRKSHESRAQAALQQLTELLRDHDHGE